MRRPSSDKRPSLLPFPAWVEKHFPRKNAKRSILKMIGALDVAYLLYRLQNNEKLEQTPAKKAPTSVKKAVEVKPTPAAQPKKTPAKKAVKPKVKKVVEPAEKEELHIEFEHKPEPIVAHAPVETPRVPPEPEPLVLQNEVIATPEPVRTSGVGTVWLDDERLEDIDLRKTDLSLATDDITVAFETAYTSDDDETLLVVNGVSWRAMLTSPALNLSQMVQILRVSYGELYVLGRMALGAMSGEGYITESSAAEIVRSLAKTTDKTLELDVQYYDKDNTSKKRVAHTIRIRFERVS